LPSYFILVTSAVFVFPLFSIKWFPTHGAGRRGTRQSV
jgi:hypothetical protein